MCEASVTTVLAFRPACARCCEFTCPLLHPSPCAQVAFQLLSALAERGQLAPLVERAQEAHTARLEERRQQQQQGGAS